MRGDTPASRRATGGQQHQAAYAAQDRRRRLIRRLVEVRRGQGRTQADVARAMGVGQSVVAEIESGRLDVRFTTLERYAEAASGGQLHLELAASPTVDRTEIRRAVRMSDAEREAYYVASNRNMLRLFADARHADD